MSSGTLPMAHMDAAQWLTQVVASMGYKIFLSGGAAATMVGTGRRVKDLDFRIVLSFSFLSANGDLFVSEVNKRMILVDPDATQFRVNDARFGRTIVSKDFMNVEVSISNTVLPLYGEMQGRAVEVQAESGPHMPVLAMGMDDIIFDKMISVMFRRKAEKEHTDVCDLLGLLALSDKHPAYYVRHLFVRRGAAYAFSSKPADLERNDDPRDAESMATRRALIESPEASMLADLQKKLNELADYVLRKTQFEEEFKELLNAVTLAIKHPPPTLTLLQVTPAVALGTGVDTSISKGGHWESPVLRGGSSSGSAATSRTNEAPY